MSSQAWKIRWEELNDKTVPKHQWVYVRHSTPVKSVADARRFFDAKTNVATSHGYRSVELVCNGELVDSWPPHSDGGGDFDRQQDA